MTVTPGTQSAKDRSVKPFAKALDDILNLRKREQGLSLEEVGRRAHMDHSYISHMRSGGRQLPPPATLRVLAAALDIEPQYFIEYRQMEKLARQYAGSREPTDTHWAMARMEVLADQAAGWSNG